MTSVGWEKKTRDAPVAWTDSFGMTNVGWEKKTRDAPVAWTDSFGMTNTQGEKKRTRLLKQRIINSSI